MPLKGLVEAKPDPFIKGTILFFLIAIRDTAEPILDLEDIEVHGVHAMMMVSVLGCTESELSGVDATEVKTSCGLRLRHGEAEWP